MNIAAVVIAYVMAGLGYYAVNNTKPYTQRARLWNNPFACALVWPALLIFTPWPGAFVGTLLGAVILYFVLTYIFSLF